MKKWIFLLLVIAALGILYWYQFHFVFGEGVKSGTLNFVVYKGYTFKTWEGRLIQEGINTKSPGELQSNEFDFSIINDSIAEVLERSGGKKMELRYKEYLNTLPWRGNSKYIVYELLTEQTQKEDSKNFLTK